MIGRLWHQNCFWTFFQRKRQKLIIILTFHLSPEVSWALRGAHEVVFQQKFVVPQKFGCTCNSAMKRETAGSNLTLNCWSPHPDLPPPLKILAHPKWEVSTALCFRSCWERTACKQPHMTRRVDKTKEETNKAAAAGKSCNGTAAVANQRGGGGNTAMPPFYQVFLEN